MFIVLCVLLTNSDYNKHNVVELYIWIYEYVVVIFLAIIIKRVKCHCNSVKLIQRMSSRRMYIVFHSIKFSVTSSKYKLTFTTFNLNVRNAILLLNNFFVNT